MAGLWANIYPIEAFNGQNPENFDNRIFKMKDQQKGYYFDVDLEYPNELHDYHKKIHGVLEFDQSDSMRKYIELNTKLRQNAKNEFEKDFFKLMNSSVFGRTMTNVWKYVNINLVLDPEKYTKLVSTPNFVKSTFFAKDLAAVHFRKTEIKFNQPI